jgi:hypothetical protein
MTMSDQEFSSPESNLENVESTERVEDQALQDATHEPGTRIEETQNYEQAEAVERELDTAMNNASAESVGSLPIPLPEPALEAEAVERELDTAMNNASEESASNMPLPLPQPALEDDGAGGEIAKGEERAGVLPVPIPAPALEDGPGSPGSEVSATPINLPREANIAEGWAAQNTMDDPDPIIQGVDESTGADHGQTAAPYKGDRPDEPPPPPDQVLNTALESNIAGGMNDLAGHKEPGDPPPPPDRVQDMANSAGAIASGEPGSAGSEVAVTPINLPNEANILGGTPGSDRMEEPDHGVNPLTNTASMSEDQLAGSRVGSDRSLSPDDVKQPGESGGSQAVGKGPQPNEPPPPPDQVQEAARSADAVASGAPGSAGSEVAVTPINLPNEANILGGTPGSDRMESPSHGPNPLTNTAGTNEGQLASSAAGSDQSLSPDDVKQPGVEAAVSSRMEDPDDGPMPYPRPAETNYEALEPSAQAVVDVIARAIGNQEYRGQLLSDARTALAGSEVSAEDQAALGEMKEEAFDFFAREVEARLNQAMPENSPSGIAGAVENATLKAVVQAVWRDLNPGSLAYVLATKIPQKHL